jgi:hypothetical protein
VIFLELVEFVLAITAILRHFVLLLLINVVFGLGIYLRRPLHNIALDEMRLIELFHFSNLLF